MRGDFFCGFVRGLGVGFERYGFSFGFLWEEEIVEEGKVVWSFVGRFLSSCIVYCSRVAIFFGVLWFSGFLVILSSFYYVDSSEVC